MNDELESKIREVFENVFPEVKNNFDWDREQSSYENWDSFSHVSLISALEDKLAVSFETDEIIKINSAKSVLELIKKKKNVN